MDSKEKSEFWLQKALKDIKSACNMLKIDELECAVFMCQQAIEKTVKALYILYLDDNIPLLHDPGKIISKFSDKLPISIPDTVYDFFAEITPYYINCRYPNYKQDIASKLNFENTQNILNRTKEVFQWLITLKKY